MLFLHSKMIWNTGSVFSSTEGIVSGVPFRRVHTDLYQLRGRLRVVERAVVPELDAKVRGELAEAVAAVAGQRALEQPQRIEARVVEPDAVIVAVRIDEAQIERGVVRGEMRIARERLEHGQRRRPCRAPPIPSRSVMPVLAVISALMGIPGLTNVQNVSTISPCFSRTAPISVMPHFLGLSPVVSRSNTTYSSSNSS